MNKYLVNKNVSVNVGVTVFGKPQQNRIGTITVGM